MTDIEFTILCRLVVEQFTNRDLDAYEDALKEIKNHPVMKFVIGKIGEARLVNVTNKIVEAFLISKGK